MHHLEKEKQIARNEKREYQKKEAAKVRKSKITATLDPMSADERRAIHNALANFKNITTVSSIFLLKFRKNSFLLTFILTSSVLSYILLL